MYWRNISLKKIILPNIENQKNFYRIKKKKTQARRKLLASAHPLSQTCSVPKKVIFTSTIIYSLAQVAIVFSFFRFCFSLLNMFFWIIRMVTADSTILKKWKFSCIDLLKKKVRQLLWWSWVCIRLSL